jgi:hypothetical protein
MTPPLQKGHTQSDGRDAARELRLESVQARRFIFERDTVQVDAVEDVLLTRALITVLMCECSEVAGRFAHV